MNQVDFFILVVVMGCVLSGYRRGLILSAGDILSLVLGLGAGSLLYPIAAFPLERLFGLPWITAGPLGLVIVSASMVFITNWGCSFLAHRFKLAKPLRKIGGGVFGAISGFVFAAALLVASGFLPVLAEPVSRSLLGPKVTSLIPRMHQSLDELGLPLPKLVRLPTDYREELRGMRQGFQFVQINFARLDDAMCINCRAPVKFLGYKFSRGTLLSPKFKCTKCGRTSDGCQTFQGFHAIYKQCPAAIASEGVIFDCGVWTNGWWTVPHGKCPVDGKEFRGVSQH